MGSGGGLAEERWARGDLNPGPPPCENAKYVNVHINDMHVIQSDNQGRYE